MPVDLELPMTQEAFGALVGVSQQSVSELVARGTLRADAPAGEWLLAYTAQLREQAAGRAANGDLQLAAERARLAREQADKVAMQNALQRREQAPVALLERALARVARQVAGILEALPVQLRRTTHNLTTEDLLTIEREIIKARNTAAAIELTWDDSDGHDGDQPGDSLRPEAA